MVARLLLRTRRSSVRCFSVLVSTVSYAGRGMLIVGRWIGSQKDVDGFLVGGASLKPEFVDIINTKRA